MVIIGSLIRQLGPLYGAAGRVYYWLMVAVKLFTQGCGGEYTTTLGKTPSDEHF